MARDLSNIATRRHPEYADRLEHWKFLEACYEGGRDWFDSHIFRYLKEGDTEFADRQQRAYRFNHSREVVDLVNKYVFRAEVSRNAENAPPSVEQFWQSATPEGHDIDYLMTQVSKRSSISGRIYIVIDNNMEDGVLSKREQTERGIRTYAYWVGPQDVLDMSFDDEGKLNWILIREKWRDDEDPFGASGDVEEQFRLWTRKDWFLFRYKKEPETNKIITDDSGNAMVYEEFSATHGLGMVPVVIVDHMDDDNKYAAPALINDIAYLDRAVANYLSNLDAIIQDQSFSQLAMPAQALMPGEEEKLKEKLTELGTKRIFLYNGEAGAEPKFLSPDPRQAQLIITAIRTIINEIYHTVGMAGERTKQDNSMGIDNSSGVAKAYDFERVNALLINKAKTLQKAEQEIMNVVAAWNGESVEDDSMLKWPTSFDVRGLADEFEVASQLSLISAPDMMRREQMKALMDKLFPTIDKTLKEEMLVELENDWPPEPEDFAFGQDPMTGTSEDDSSEGDDSEDQE